MDEEVDVGVAVREGKEVTVDVFSGNSVLSPGQASGQNEVVGQVLSPLTQNEVGTIRCIGLNVSTFDRGDTVDSWSLESLQERKTLIHWS